MHSNPFKAIFIAEILCIAIYLMVVQAYEIHFWLLLLQLIIIFLALYLSRISIGPGLEAAAVFILIFMGIMPILEELNSILYWGGSISLNEKINGSFLIALSAILMILGYCLAFKRIPSFKFKEISYSNNDVLRISFYILLLAYFLLVKNDFNMSSFLTKESESNPAILVNSKAEFLTIEFFLRPLIFNLGLSVLFFSRVGWFKKSIILLITIFFAFPTGISRFLVGILYMPFVYLFALKKREVNNLQYRKYFFSSFLILALIFIFPILEIFRKFSSQKFESFTIGNEFLLAGHYDAYQMFLHALQTDTPTFGYGFLGIVLFFIPRSLWPSKPINSGMEVAELMNLTFTNVSMPIFGELYLNFSYVGILFGSLFLGVIFKIFDKNFTSKNNMGMHINGLIFMQISGSIIILMRGGLLSEFAYVVSIMLTWIVIYADNIFFRNRDSNKMPP